MVPATGHTQDPLLERISQVLGSCAAAASPPPAVTLAAPGPVIMVTVCSPDWAVAAAGGANVGRYADLIMASIGADRDRGDIPAAVATLAGVHEHVDVNRYLQQAGISPAWAARPVFIRGTTDHESHGSPFLDALCAELNRRLCLAAAAHFAQLADSAWTRP